MDLFIVGDVHGCYKTFTTLLRKWNPEKEQLIQLGDFIDRGNDNPQTVKLCRELQQQHGAIFLKGNHEQMALEYFAGNADERWSKKYGIKVLWQYTLEEIEPEEDFLWMTSLPAYWENEHVFVSHAGISNSPFCMDEKHSDGLLWNRGAIKNIGKMQVFGHTPVKSGKPLFIEESNAWNIDTGAYRGKSLSAIRMDSYGKMTEIISIATSREDIS